MNLPSRVFRRLLCLALLLPVLLLPEAILGQGMRKQHPNIDARFSSPAPAAVTATAAAAMKNRRALIARNVAAGLVQLRTGVRGADVKVSPVTGSAEVVSAAGTLTAAAPGRTGFDITRDFLQANATLYGLAAADIANLHFIGESVSQASGLRMVRVEQMVNGWPVFQSETRFTIDRNGRIIRSVGQMVPDATATAAPAATTVSAQKALASALASVNLTLDPAAMTLANTAPNGSKTDVVANHPKIKGRVPSSLVYFPVSPGVLVPAWSQVSFTKDGADWLSLVDANSGTLLWRKNIRAHASTEDARFSVYVQADGRTPADSPSPLSPTNAVTGAGVQPQPITRTTVSMFATQNLTASPNGWLSDGGNTTTGNNVDAYLDRNDDNAPDTGSLDNNGRPVGNIDASTRNRDFLGTGYDYSPPPNAANPEAGTDLTDPQFQRGALTQLFYVTNWYHDRLHALGFDAAAGNFQTDNFGAGGVGGDPVLAEAQDGAGNPYNGANRNNANFSAPPDGTPGRMQMYIFDGPTVDRDGSLDAEIVMHELTHGLSNRLIGNGAGLTWAVGAGMGEGWSDFYALSLLNNTNADNPNGKYALGAYATYKFTSPIFTDNYLYGIRRFPYSTDHNVNPLTWADVDDVTNNLSGGIPPSLLNSNFYGACEVHNIGEIWCNTLWGVRSRIIADPAGANGDVPAGNNRTLQIVTDAMKMTPINPSFIDARDALIAADAATNAGANELSIWQGFADRGLGYNAVAPYSRMFGYYAGHMGIGESFSIPHLDVQSVAIDDSIGNSNGAIDPGEPVRITVRLNNPWRAASFGVASASATLAASTPGVTIATASATYPAIAALGSADGTKFQFIAPPGATAGQPLKFTITVTSALGTKAVDFTVRVGSPAGNGAPVTYTRTIPGGLAIPDASPRGVFDTFTVTDDLEIADLNFRIDNLTHTWTGDVTVLLRAPNGLGTDLITALGALADGGAGANFINTVIDDQAPGDLFIAYAASAPFTGSWAPMFNTQFWDYVFAPHDPVGQLSRYNGLGTKGDWKVLVSDQGAIDTGSLNAWSLIVTPKAYTVTPLTPSQSWRTGAFGTAANTGNAADTADPNNNGIRNLLEYALGGDPAGGTTGTGVLPLVGRSAGNTLQLDFTRYADRTDLTLTVQAADSPAGPWTDLAVSMAGGAFGVLATGATAPEGGSGNARSVTVTDLYAVTDPLHPARFMRLRVGNGVAVDYTDPVGFMTLNVKGTGGTKASEVTYLGLGMASKVDYQGLAETVSGTTLTCSAATWTDNQFASTPAPGYFLEVFSGANAGLLTQVVSCNAAARTLTVADNLISLGVESANVTFRIRQNWSLSRLFGATNSAGFTAGNSTTADLILIYNPTLGGGAGGYDQYFYSSGGLVGVGWRKVGGGNASQANVLIAQDEGLIIKRLGSADLSMPLSASVKLSQTLSTVSPGPNFIGNVYPSGALTLGLTDAAASPPKYSSNLFTGNSATGVVGGTSTTADLILIYNPTLGGGAGGFDQYFYSTGGLVGVGWRKVGGGNTNQAGTVLATGRAIYLKRSTGAGNFNWVMPQPFPNP